MIIAIDNNILVNFVCQTVNVGNLETFLLQNNATLLIPTPVISEFVAYDFNERRQQLLSMNYTNIVHANFDRKAALICGDLANRIDKRIMDGRKQKVKIDLQMIAVALANNAHTIRSLS